MSKWQDRFLKPPCAVDDCLDHEWSRGWCMKHYQRWKRYGDPIGPRPPTNEERFWAKVNKHGPMPVGTLAVGNCWEWTSPPEKGGYGQFRIGGRPRKAHIVAWEAENGPVPTGLMLDHICRRPICVRPGHLRLIDAGGNNENREVTSRINPSGFRNVRQVGPDRWVAEVRASGVTYRRPRRSTKEEAIADARELRLEHHRHNDVDRTDPPNGP